MIAIWSFHCWLWLLTCFGKILNGYFRDGSLLVKCVQFCTYNFDTVAINTVGTFIITVAGTTRVAYMIPGFDFFRAFQETSSSICKWIIIFSGLYIERPFCLVSSAWNTLYPLRKAKPFPSEEKKSFLGITLNWSDGEAPILELCWVLSTLSLPFI